MYFARNLLPDNFERYLYRIDFPIGKRESGSTILFLPIIHFRIGAEQDEATRTTSKARKKDQNPERTEQLQPGSKW